MEDKKFNVGDHVIITKGHTNFVPEMHQYIGQKAILTRHRRKAPNNSTGCGSFEIDLDGGFFSWIYEQGHFKRDEEYYDTKVDHNITSLYLKS